MKTHSIYRRLLVALGLATLLPAIAMAEFTIDVEVIGAGEIAVTPETGPYAEGTQVTLTAYPELRHALAGWGGDASSQEDEIIVTMDADKSITAEFGKIVIVGPHQYAFGAATVSLASSVAVGHAFIAGDDLSMYYTAMRYDLLPRTVTSIFRVIRPDINAPWSEPVDLMNENVNAGLHYNWIMDPSLTDDGLTLYYLTLRVANPEAWPTAGRWLVVRRASTDEEFDFSQPEPLGPTMRNDEVIPGAVTDNAGPGGITRDGTGFIFTSTRAGGSSRGAIWYSAWDPNVNDIGAATLVAADPSNRYTSPEMSADGLTVMFWHTGSPQTIYMVARATVDDPWSEAVSLPRPIATGGEQNVTMSSDMTKIYFDSHRSGTAPIDPRDPRGPPPGGPGVDVFEAKMRRLAFPSVVLTTDSDRYGKGGEAVLTPVIGKSDLTIARVEYYEGDTFIGESLEMPFTFVWPILGNGPYELTARAFDDAGDSALSETVRITVGGRTR